MRNTLGATLLTYALATGCAAVERDDADAAHEGGGTQDGGGAPDGGMAPDGPRCSDGTVQDGEECDEGAANATAGSCCDGGCHLVAAGTTCREAAQPCDTVEVCTGADATCPADGFAADGSGCVSGVADTCCGGQCLIGHGSCSCAIPDPAALTVVIVESQSAATWAVQDTVWQAQAIALGHSASIVPQTALDSITTLAGANVLIVSSGTIHLSAPRLATIEAFVASGRGVFLQGEYVMSDTANQGFATIVNDLGGVFAWSAELSGEQQPVSVVGCPATIPLAVPAITDFYYAVTGSGSGSGFASFLAKGDGTPLGFRFCRAGGGAIINSTDADFVWRHNPVEYMTNVITWLGAAPTCNLWR